MIGKLWVAWHLWLTVEQRFIKRGRSLEAIPLKKWFVPEKLQLNIAAWHSMVQSSSSEFFPRYTGLSYILRFGPVLLLVEDEEAEKWFFKEYNARWISQQHNSTFSTFLINGITLGQALLDLGQCRNYRVCNVSLSLQLTCEELFINRASVAHLSHDISFFHSWDHFHIHSCWPPNHHQVPANSARRKIPYLRLFKARWDSTCSLLESESLEDDLVLLSSLEVDCCGFPLDSSFVRGKSDWKRLFLNARTELTFPRGTGSPRPSLGFIYRGNLSFMSDSVLNGLFFSMKLLSLKGKGLPPNGLAKLSGWGLWFFGLPYSCGSSEGGIRMSDRILLRGPNKGLSWGFWW